MSERGRVVVGVDGSDESREALRYGLEDAARRGADLEVVWAFHLPEYWAVPYGLTAPPSVEEITRNLENRARQLVDEVVSTRDGDLAKVAVDVVAVPGTPAKMVVEQARGADLLVLGHRGRGAFTSAMLGSVGLHCVLHAPCPVTIVRPAARPATVTEPAQAEPAQA
jgi:nucleotide-binding universal stress UspA family protein